MKKIYAILTALTFMAGAFGEGYFQNRLGACSDADGTEFGKELFTINEDDKSELHFAEYAEFAYNWEKAEILGLFAINNSAYEDPKNNIKAAGYGVFYPLPFLSVAAGNDLRDRFSFSGGELYTENEAFLLQANPFADGAGLIFSQKFGDIGIYALANIGAEKGAILNAGLAVSYENDNFTAAIQAVGQNILNKNEYYHYAVFGYLNIQNYDISLGYISNYNDQNISNFDSEEVSKQNYLPLPSTHVVKLSGRYKADLFTVGADLLFGLNDEYILNEESKKLRAVWDSWEKGGFNPVIKGCGSEDGKLGKNDQVPWMVSVKGGYYVTEDISLYLKYSLLRGNDFNHLIYPYADWALSETSFFRLGAKFKIEESKFSVSIPLMWRFLIDIN